MRIAIVDYGLGNLLSVKTAFDYLGYSATIVSEPDGLSHANLLVLPGVGAFAAGIKHLSQSGCLARIEEMVWHRKIPILGICLGMQLMFEHSQEGDGGEGLGWFRGSVQKINSRNLPLPHVGWNNLTGISDSQLYHRLTTEVPLYFDHSYRVICDEEIVSAKVRYGEEFVASIRKDNIFGVQFHPEKSGFFGLRVMHNIIRHINGK